jgi:hypothetical protein
MYSVVGQRMRRERCNQVVRARVIGRLRVLSFPAGGWASAIKTCLNSCQSIARSFVSGKKINPTNAVAEAITIGYQRSAKILP